MPSYIARVELHQADADDYQTLHASMERRGYSRTITSSEGVVYWLPTGTYDAATSTASLQQALDAAKSAATETRRTHSIIVAERSGATWHGLVRR